MALPTRDAAADPRRRNARRAAWGALAGTSIEWYDFYIFATASALVIGPLFFPDGDPIVSLSLSLATFAIGFVLRPLGAIVFGYIGDRVSRRTALLITLVVMGGATLGIGLLPTYDDIGVAAPILLLSLRCLQGLSVGGEWGGAVLIASEAAPPHRKALAASMAQAGAPIGSILASGAFLLLPTGDALLEGWWRAPFLLSAVLIVVGFVIRARLEENEEFLAARDRATATGRRSPIVDVLRRFPITTVIVFLASMAVSGAYFRNVFALSWSTDARDLARDVFLAAQLAGGVLQIILTPIAAILADRIGLPRAQRIWTATYLIVTPFPLFWLVGSGDPALATAGVLLAFLGHALYYATLSGFLTTLFPVELRFTGISIGYQLSGSLVSGLVPLVAVQLVAQADGSILPVQLLYTAFVALSLLAAFLGPRIAAREAERFDRASQPASPSAITTSTTDRS